MQYFAESLNKFRHRGQVYCQIFNNNEEPLSLTLHVHVSNPKNRAKSVCILSKDQPRNSDYFQKDLN